MKVWTVQINAKCVIRPRSHQARRGIFYLFNSDLFIPDIVSLRREPATDWRGFSIGKPLLNVLLSPFLGFTNFYRRSAGHYGSNHASPVRVDM